MRGLFIVIGTRICRVGDYLVLGFSDGNMELLPVDAGQCAGEVVRVKQARVQLLNEVGFADVCTELQTPFSPDDS